PASALALRCALEASERFSPRSALALSSVAALCGAASGLLARGGLRQLVPGRRAAASSAAFMGGTLGRCALLIYASHFTGSLELSRMQAAPLLALSSAALYALRHQPFKRPEGRSSLFLLALLCGLCDGFVGAGGMALLALFSPGGVRRRSGAPSSLSLLISLCAQAGALLLTLFAGAAQVFPPRMLLFLALGAAAGGFLAQKERGASPKGLRAALITYGVVALLSVLEQAFYAAPQSWAAP
ncbi:MAG: TSUP family transporter, partial [Clostridia bacterium]|nr:TSUP family transporter [Clostridia bacterium]